MILLISLLFLIPFPFLYFFFISIFLHIFYLSLLLFLFSFIHFYLLYFSFYAFPSYFLTFPTHCLAVPKLILLYLLFHITILTVNIASCQATVPYFIWQLLISLVPLLNYFVIQPYCAIVDHLLIFILL